MHCAQCTKHIICMCMRIYRARKSTNQMISKNIVDFHEVHKPRIEDWLWHRKFCSAITQHPLVGNENQNKSRFNLMQSHAHRFGYHFLFLAKCRRYVNSRLMWHFKIVSNSFAHYHLHLHSHSKRIWISNAMRCDAMR